MWCGHGCWPDTNGVMVKIGLVGWVCQVVLPCRRIAHCLSPKCRTTDESGAHGRGGWHPCCRSRIYSAIGEDGGAAADVTAAIRPINRAPTGWGGGGGVGGGGIWPEKWGSTGLGCGGWGGRRHPPVEWG